MQSRNIAFLQKKGKHWKLIFHTMNLKDLQLTNKTMWIFYVLLGICIIMFTMLMNNSCSEKRNGIQSVITWTSKNATDEPEKGATKDRFFRRIIKVFDNGPRFDYSFSPLYQNKSSKIIERNTRHQNFDTDRHLSNVDCSSLFQQNLKEIERVRNLNTTSNSPTFCNQTIECNSFILSRGYIMDSLTDDERDFPIAYSILVYESPEQFEILLRAIYRPQNAYCVHVDRKTTENVFNEFSCIAQCFPNVKLASKRMEVEWGKIGIVLAELSCMKDLLSFSMINTLERSVFLELEISLFLLVDLSSLPINFISITKENLYFVWMNLFLTGQGMNITNDCILIQSIIKT
nr:uncharacterized protein LOC117691383 [Crassostrea gigas]